MLRFACLSSALALTALTGCGGPFLVFPGGELHGTVVDEPVADWSFALTGELEGFPEDRFIYRLDPRD